MTLQIVIIVVGALSFIHLMGVATAIQYHKTRLSLMLEVVLGAGFSVGMVISALQGNIPNAALFTLVVLGSYVAYHLDLDLSRPRTRTVERRWRSGPSTWQSSHLE